MRKATLINAVTRRQRPYRNNHPLAIPRTALAIDLIRAYDALNEDEPYFSNLFASRFDHPEPEKISKQIQRLAQDIRRHLYFRI